MKQILTILFFVFALLPTAPGQDLHFSQFYNSPLTTNPANTGFLPDADYRVGVQYRNQWSSIMSIPFKTMTAFGDAQVFRNKLETGWMGLGGVLLSDVAGSGSLRSNKVYASVAYHQMLGLSSLVSLGFNLGYASKRIDVTGLKFPDQFDGKFFDTKIPSSAVITDPNINYFDMQVGMNYAYFPNENTYLNLGYAVHHVNRPRETFFNTAGNDGLVPRRHIAFANAILRVADRVIIYPNVFYSNQAKAQEISGGVLADYNLTEQGDKQFAAGIYYRHQDAVIPTAGFVLNGNLRFTFSYDVTLSSVRNYNQYRGAYELSIIKKGLFPQSGDRQIMCPKF